MLVASSRLGPYEIVAPLGAGGMGEVYRARDTRLGREVAVKVLPELFAHDPDRRARFEREAKAVATLSHPNILAIHDYGTEGVVTYAVMELLEGETLRDRLTKGPLPWREAVEIGAAIVEGLAAAHAKGIVHRDLKPENLFLTTDGRVKILDFGLARITPPADSQSETGPHVPAETDPGAVMGTAGYMSPEQVRGQPVDARSDLFAFGCVLYEMVTGRRAFQRDTAAETMTAILHDEPAELASSARQMPVELGRVIRQCLAKNPSQRLQSARDLALGLRTTATDLALHRSPATRHFSPLLVGILAAAVLIGVLGASAYFLTRGSNPSGSGKPVAEAKAIGAVAVLPFENVGDDPKTVHLSEGIPDTIIHGLSRLRQRDLKVQSLTSVARYKRRKPDLAEIRRDLGVGAVVSGRLQQRGDSLFVSVSLIDVHDGSEIWGKPYERKLDDILALQDEIAKDIAANLRLHLTGEEEKRLTKSGTENPEAYQLYLQGRYFWNKRTAEGMKKGIEYFKGAIEKDRAYALAYAGLADSYVLLATYGFVPQREAMPQAKESALKALEIDDKLPEAHASLAFISQRYDWNWADAERRYQRAIELNPNYPTAHLWYAYYLAERRRFDDARAEAQRAQELDPLSLMAASTVGWAFYFARQYDPAIEQFKKTLEIDPYFWVAHDYLARTYFQKGMYDQAIAEFQKAKTLSPSIPIVVAELGYTQAVSGNKNEARVALDELKELSKHRYIPSFLFAIVYSGLGEKDQAFEWLEKAYEERSGVFAYIEVEPMFDGLRSDPRVMDLLRRVGPADKGAERDQGVHSVAVLPFENVGGDPKAEFLSDGVADQIINSLSQVRRRDLKIRPFTSVSRYKGQKPDVPAFGRQLNVQMIVTGTLHQQGEELTIRVALVDVREDNHLWGNTYRSKLGGILDLQDQIARDVAANLRLRLTGEEEQRLTKRYTEDPEAYLLYREGLYQWGKFTEEGITSAREYFERALRKDANYALAHSGLARCCITLGALYRGPRVTYPEAKKHLARAQKLDANLPDAHAGMGAVHLFYDWDWPAAKRELEQGMELDPSFPGSNLYGFYLAAVGRPGEALAPMQRDVESDPLSAVRANELAMCYVWLRRYDDAIAAAQKALELDPRFPLAYVQLGIARAGKARYEEAIAELSTALKSGQRHPHVRGMLGYAYAAAGKRAEAQKVLDELKVLAQGRFAFALPIARIHAALGEKDQAFDWLQKACDERDSAVIFLKFDPTLDNLRNDPRFAQVVKDMGLPP